MLLRHVINTYVGSKIFKSSLPKVQNSDKWLNNSNKALVYLVDQ